MSSPEDKCDFCPKPGKHIVLVAKIKRFLVCDTCLGTMINKCCSAEIITPQLHLNLERS